MEPKVSIASDLRRIYRDSREYFVLSAFNKFYLVENKCSHRGGPLKFGAFDQACRLVCPWHKNAFSLDQLLAMPTTIEISAQERRDLDEVV